jgi:uncharacterized protein (TIGR03086 family)
MPFLGVSDQAAVPEGASRGHRPDMPMHWERPAARGVRCPSMSEISDRYSRVASGFATRLEHCPTGTLDNLSPCEGWTGRDVASHVIHVHRRVLAALDGADGGMPAAEDDLVAAFLVVSRGVSAALLDPTRASRNVSGMFGEQSFEQLVGRLLCADTLVHSWDLARATGQDDRLDADAAEKALEFLEPIDEAVRRPGGFGSKLVPAPEADAQSRLLAFTGRNG